MPLHLLGKKSWNVYNQDNIAKVRRDEAEAEAQEAERERESRSEDAERRLQILRGNLQPDSCAQTESTKQHRVVDDPHRPAKRRKLPGEDDTDRDIRLVRQSETGTRPQRPYSQVDDIVDKNGHISLVPRKTGSKPNIATESDRLPSSKEAEQSGIPLAEVLGRNSDGQKPWYTSSAEITPSLAAVTKDVWGNEDPSRKARSERRLAVDDPLAAIKKGVKQLRQAERHRENWKQQRERDLNEVEELARRATRHHRRRSTSIEPLDLDCGSIDKQQRRMERRHHHRHRSRSRSPRTRHHHKHRHRTHDGAKKEAKDIS